MLGATLVPAAWQTLDGNRAAVLAAMFVVISAAIYALHAVTFDSLRLLKNRDPQIFSTGSHDE